MRPDLSILCVTRCGAHAEPFLREMDTLAQDLGAEFVVCVDSSAPRDQGTLMWDGTLLINTRTHLLTSAGYIESVLDEAVATCVGEYVLRLDDDERVSPDMAAWLKAQTYFDNNHWAFPRMHLWPDAEHYIANEPLWPDLQTRLSVKDMSGGRTQIHAGSPFGTGKIAEVAIEHHKFLVRSREERAALMAEYRAIMPSADDWLPFSVPELFAEQIETRAVGC